MNARNLISSTLASIVICCSGCGDGPTDMPTLAAASGTLLLKGNPLPHAEVRFIPTTEGAPSYAMTDEQGNFELRYSATEMGAVVGSHAVGVTIFGERGPVEVEGELGPPLNPPKEIQLGQFKIEPEGTFLAIEVAGR